MLADPPHEILMFVNPERGYIDTVVGPYQVGKEFELSCEVRGGKVKERKRKRESSPHPVL